MTIRPARFNQRQGNVNMNMDNHWLDFISAEVQQKFQLNTELQAPSMLVLQGVIDLNATITTLLKVGLCFQDTVTLSQ